MIVHQAVFAVFPLMMAYAAVSDLLTMTIPNRVVLAGAVGFAAAVPLAGLDLAAVGQHLAAGAIVLAIGFTLFSFRWIGGGDAKLAAVGALWMGLGLTVDFLFYATLFGGALTTIVILARRTPLPAMAVRQQWLMRLHDPASGVPYGLALAAAGLVLYPQTAWIALVA